MPHNVKLIGVQQRENKPAVRPVEHGVRLLGFCVISAGIGLG